MAALAACHGRVVVDLGCGDGRYVLARAAAEPSALVLGIDANAAGMAEAASRARRDRLASALFVVAAAEALPPELDGLVDELRLHFPWGSLLRGLLDGEATVPSGIARLMRPGAEATALLSVTARDGALGLAPLCADTGPALAAAYARHGLSMREWRLATADEVAAARSSWAKRLGVGRGREAWVMGLERG